MPGDVVAFEMTSPIHSQSIVNTPVFAGIQGAFGIVRVFAWKTKTREANHQGGYQAAAVSNRRMLERGPFTNWTK